MSRENVEVVRRIFDRRAVRDFSAGIDDFDEHIVLIVPPDFPDSGQLHGVGVAQQVRCDAAPDTGVGGEPAKLAADGGARPRSPAGGTIDDAEQRAHRELDTHREPGL